MIRHLNPTASTYPGFDTQLHEIPFVHVVIGRTQAASAARIAIITVLSRLLEEALTICELVRQTQAPVPDNIDMRGIRFCNMLLDAAWPARRGAHVAPGLTRAASGQIVLRHEWHARST